MDLSRRIFNWTLFMEKAPQNCQNNYIFTVMNKSEEVPKVILGYCRVMKNSIQFTIASLFLQFTVKKPDIQNLLCK